MKILFAVQGTGNGHLTRAEDVLPKLCEHGEVDVMISGLQAEVSLLYPVKYKSKGLGFFFGTSGGIDFLKTFKKNNAKEFYREIRKIPVEKYDMVINDFEPITAWACRSKEVPCVGLSHQSALLSPKVPKPAYYFDPVGEWILHHYAPADAHVSFHFSSYDDMIYTPVIRRSIRDCKRQEMNHYTVYLPSYDDRKIVRLLARIPHVSWEIFSKHTKRLYQLGRISVFPVNKDAFGKSMTSAKGVLCGAGFETPAEALYLNKKLMVIPMKSQLEQHYNAAALQAMGIPVIKKLGKKHLDKIGRWIESNDRVSVNYEDTTADAVARAVALGRQL